MQVFGIVSNGYFSSFLESAIVDYHGAILG